MSCYPHSGLHFCDSCEVTESRDPDYISRTRTVTSQPWFAGKPEIRYINHATEHWPSPA